MHARDSLARFCCALAARRLTLLMRTHADMGGDCCGGWGNASTAAECCAQCDANADCKYWSWIEDMDPKRCALKSKL
jgi:hypothetical protein